MPSDSRTTLAPGRHIDGFTVTRFTPLADLRATACELEHAGSGARLLHVHNDDAENLFSISFPTPPLDDTGVPHILEHSVLAGSRKYPVKEPFFEMVKMSMATFINAMTGPDCTYYPVASNVPRDLFNLADVYFDAVFHPLLTTQTFQREAHHLAPAVKDKPTGRLTINGIVYNEMKGAFSDPESRLYRAQSRGLCPDTPYGLESGGDPLAIPALTHEGLKRFHDRYYHPGNAYFFFYGNIPTRDYLAFLKERLQPFRRARVDVTIPLQPRWTKPGAATDTYPVGRDETLAEKTYIVTSWLAGDATQPRDVVLMRLLGLILFGNEAAPLKKAIIASKLGADLVFSGDGAMGREGTFAVGLKGSEPRRAAAFTALVMKTLSRIVKRGVDSEWVDAAFQQVAYEYLEIQSMYPLHVMDHALHAWIYGGDPLDFLRMRETLRACRSEVDADPGIFARLIRERLLDNPHRLTVTLKPDRAMEARQRAAFAARMRAIRKGMSDGQMRQIAAAAEELERLNSEPNPPEELARLPQLKVSDLPERLTHIPTAVDRLKGVDLLRNDVSANGVNYLILDFDLKGLPAELWPFLPRYAEAVGKLGAAGMDYERMARREAGATGGLGCHPVLTSHARDADRPLWRLRFNLKALDERIEPALAVLGDILFGLDPRDRPRLRDVLVQALARYRTDMVHHGSGTAACHAGRGLTPGGHLAEILHGLPQLHLSEALNRQFDSRGEELMLHIETLRDFLLVRGRLTVSFTGSDAAFAAVRWALSNWIGRMRREPVCEAPVGFEPYETPPREGLAGPIQVAHCALVMPAAHYSHPDETLLAVATHLVRMDYILSEIRFKGNAYGAALNHDPFGSTMQFGSYNDPHVARTLEVFAGTREFVQQAPWTQTDVDRAIIATAKREERPIRPGAATGEALQRHINGMTPERRERRFARLKNVTPRKAKRAMLEALEAGLPRGAVCVVSSRKKLEEANARMPERPLAIQDILKED